LTVFLASPGDVADERRAVRDVVVELNRTLTREAKWEVELLGWEDTLPGAKRPQELINEDVDACYLFVGILWRRWGQHSGKYTSGFEEEFERARERNARTGEPEIWLFFKGVDPDQRSDAGEQLQRVLDFRSERERQKDFLYREVPDTDQFKGEFRESLLRYTLKLAFEDIRSATQPAESAPPPDTTKAAATQEQMQGDWPAARELKDCFQTIVAELQRVPVDELLFSPPLSTEQAIRVFLFGSSTVSWRHTGEVLGTHDQNLVYKHGRDFHVVIDEATLLIRGVLSDSSDLIPGWVWLQGFTAEGLRYFARRDREPMVRRGALRLLADAVIQLEGSEARAEFFGAAFADDDIDTVREALRYFAAIGAPDDLSLLDAISDVRLRGDVQFALVVVRIRSGELETAIAGVMESEGVTKPTVEMFEAHAALLSVDQLLRLVRHPDAKLRLASTRELVKRSELSAEISRELVQDKSADLRREGLAMLIALGESVDAQEVRDAFKDSLFAARHTRDLILRAFERKTIEELQELVDWYSVDADEAYEALARKSPDALATMREDLRTDFSRIKRLSLDAFRERYGTAGSEYVLTKLDQKVDRFIADSLRTAAARALADLGGDADREVMLEMATAEDQALREQALRFFERVGRPTDAQPLVAAALKERDADLTRRLVRLVLRLETSAAIAAQFIDHGETLATAAIDYLRTARYVLPDDNIEGLLKHDTASVRRAATAALVARYDRPQLEATLNRYISQDSYFYNVACWLDRILYAPAVLAEYYRTKLPAGGLTTS
jgi:hypothetical protein